MVENGMENGWKMMENGFLNRYNDYKYINIHHTKLVE